MVMALEQTLSLSSSLLPKHTLLSIPRNRFRIASLSHLDAAKRLRFARRFPKCSAMENFSNYSTSYRKPPEIPWSKELSNSVSLIGTVGTPVEIKHLASGKDVAWTRLAVWKSSTETSWINLTFWDELAHIAFQHVQKGNQIHVSGRLVADLVEADDGKQQTYYKVVVQQLNFIERSISTAPHHDQDSNSIVAGRKLGNGAADNMGSTQELWQAFFANPVDWWDNRKNKNPKYPDFKHKDTGEALWVEGRYNPPWVKSQLAVLDMRMGSLDEQEAKMANFVTNLDFPSY
ncbi:protein OSB2, chloroplastic-like isoform X2 [Momordica charantia]|uniref:Protein OSB2, chloroplastic-like isoform X2 n=1 Tax=Momordica charantia TaxID=3673 RepID=A0A6J1DNW7_MOMCH|nr:protein OSB2, chloroplastic-like isoform X2 [Momordica charantia]